MSIWYDGTNLNMFQGDTGKVVFSGIPTDKEYDVYFSVRSVKSEKTIFEIKTNVVPLWFNANGDHIEKVSGETDREYELRMQELSLRKPPAAYKVGCAFVHIPSVLSRKLIVAKNGIKNEYNFGVKICNEELGIEDTLIPSLYQDKDTGEFVLGNARKLIVYTQYVEGIFPCQSKYKYDIEPDIASIDIDIENLENIVINTEVLQNIEDYNKLKNKPTINGVVLEGDLTGSMLGLVTAEMIAHCISTKPQKLTALQRATARENIGVVTLEGITDPTITTQAEYVGQQYINTADNKIFVCTKAKPTTDEYTWVCVNGEEISLDFEIENTMSIIIPHYLNKFPSVTIVNTNGEVCIGDIKYISANEIEISFLNEFSGNVYLN
jgi:hypothetical protein